MPELSTCDICGSKHDLEEMCGCENCGRLFGPCCNSEEDSICVECIGNSAA